MFPNNTVGASTTHGAVVTGMQDIGVKTTIAADVVEATVGLARLVHIPNGTMFAFVLLSMIRSQNIAGYVLLVGNTISILGPSPKLH